MSAWHTLTHDSLASRQRKKKHTEDLEVKEKGYTQQITMLENQVNELSIENSRREEERRMLVHRYQESQRVIETLHDQIRDMKMHHNEETSNLRRKVNILTDQLEAGPAPAMSAAPSSTGFTDFNAEMEALNMGPQDWDNFIFINGDMHNDTTDEFTFESRPEPAKLSPTLEKRPSSSTVVAEPPKQSSGNPADQPIASGLLFMLLLCGAFVVSKPASSQPRDMPKMPAEVRKAAPTVLENLLSESVSTPSNTHVRNMRTAGHEPQPSGLPYSAPNTNSRLDQMHQRLTSPTRQQEIDQAFSLTTAQYASITHMDFPPYNDHAASGSNSDAPPRPRRNLAEALATMQQEHRQSSKAEVYTRSLLWDQIPADVVKQFKEVVRDHNEIESRQKRRTSHDDMFGFKTEP